MPELNVPLMENVLAHIIMNPEEHDQRDWGRQTACGTQHCVAGWAAALSPEVKIEWMEQGSSGAVMSSVVMADGRDLSPGNAGAELLGLAEESVINGLFPVGVFRGSMTHDETVAAIKDLLNEGA